MIAVDFEILMENLTKIPREDEFDPDAGEELRTLLLVLAGDQRVISKLSLEDMAELFDDSVWLLEQYSARLENSFNEEAMENYADVMRRAV